MAKSKNLKFNHLEYGACYLDPVLSPEEAQEFSPGYNKYKSKDFLSFKVFSFKYGLLGLAGLQKFVDGSAEIFLYLEVGKTNTDLKKDILGVMLDYGLNTGFCQNVVASPNAAIQITEEVLLNCGFIKNDINFEINSMNRKLFILSSIIKNEAKNMLANREKLAHEINGRVSDLWYPYFSKGEVNLSGGGVEKSIISLRDLIHSPSLEGFNVYQHEEAPVISQERIKTFLWEEQIFRDASLGDRFSATFSLGAHEAFMRISRCIYQSNRNTTMFFPTSCYGLFPAALLNMQPLAYDVIFLNIDRDRGEKISIPHFKQLIKQHPSARTLCLELKTMCGAVYDDTEIAQIVSLCKENDIFLLADATHSNLEFGPDHAYSDILNICQERDFHEISLIHTASKTYGLERARVGFILLDEQCKQLNVKQLENDLVAVLGTVNDVSKHIAHFLMEVPLEKRRAFTRDLQLRHKFNMNLMIAYIEGIEDSQIDPELKDEIRSDIPLQYQGGIPGVKVVYKPVGGIHMKIDVEGLQHLYYANIRLFNSEIFCYVLNKIMGVISLHAFCLADPKGYGLRLTFSRKNEVHQGMRLIHDFTKLLKTEPTANPFLPGVLAEELIFNSSNELMADIL